MECPVIWPKWVGMWTAGPEREAAAAGTAGHSRMSQRTEMCQEQSGDNFYIVLGQVGMSPSILPHSCCPSTHYSLVFGSGGSWGCPGR